MTSQRFDNSFIYLFILNDSLCRAFCFIAVVVFIVLFKLLHAPQKHTHGCFCLWIFAWHRTHFKPISIVEIRWFFILRKYAINISTNTNISHKMIRIERICDRTFSFSIDFIFSYSIFQFSWNMIICTSMLTFTFFIMNPAEIGFYQKKLLRLH